MEKWRADAYEAWREDVESFLRDYRDSDAGPIDQDEFGRLGDLIDQLVSLKYTFNEIGRLPVEVHLVDRTRCEEFPYKPIPYPRESDPLSRLDLHLHNMRMAMEDLRWFAGESRATSDLAELVKSRLK